MRVTDLRKLLIGGLVRAFAHSVIGVQKRFQRLGLVIEYSGPATTRMVLQPTPAGDEPALDKTVHPLGIVRYDLVGPTGLTALAVEIRRVRECGRILFLVFLRRAGKAGQGQGYACSQNFHCSHSDFLPIGTFVQVFEV